MTEAETPEPSRDRIVVSLATIPRRLANLERVVGRLVQQCHQLNVYLNGHRSVPSFLLQPTVQVALSRDHGDRGDAGKFWWCEGLGDAYHLTVDDDILYPRDYCRRLVAKIDQFGRRAAVGVHGVMLPQRVGNGYYGERRVYPCFRGLRHSKAVHLLGTGTLGYHTSTLDVRRADFRRPNMADIWFCLVARRQGIPLVCIRRTRGWLADLGDPRPGSTIAATQSRHDGIQAASLRTMNPWPKPLTVEGVERGTMRREPKGILGVHRLERVHATSGREFGARKLEREPDRGRGIGSTGVKIKR